jgi:hypothetical protein
MTSNIYQKLAKAQQELGVLEKNQPNPFFKSMYLTLDKITANLLPVLEANGLLVVQLPDGEDLVTQVIDTESGEKIESRCRLQCVAGDPQKQGSAITYARRYSLGALFQICTEIDDDGNTASGKTRKSEPKKRPVLTPDNPRWQGALQALKEGRTSVAVILKNFYVPAENLDELKEAENA